MVPLRTRIADALRERILNGSLKAGLPLIEVRLAAELRVSRAPVREAIRILAREGLVDTVSYKGSTVRSLSPRDLDEVASLRAVLAGFAAGLLVGPGRRIDATALESALALLRDAVSRSDATGAEAAERAFLDALIAMAGHGLLEWVWGLLQLRAGPAMQTSTQAAMRRRLRLLTAVRDALGEGDAVHARDLLGAIRQANRPAAKRSERTSGAANPGRVPGAIQGRPRAASAASPNTSRPAATGKNGRS